MDDMTRAGLRRRCLGRRQESLPFALIPQATPFILSEKDCLSPRSHSIFVNIPSAASEHSRGKTFATQHTERMCPDNACEIVVKPSSACCKARQPPFYGVIEVTDGLRAECALSAKKHGRRLVLAPDLPMRG